MEAADSNGSVECVTCNCKTPWKQMQAGHLIGGRTNGVLFDERGIFPQCVGCNMFKQGMGPEFTVFVIKHYGQGLVDELIQLRRTAVRFTRSELEEMLEGYRRESMTIKRTIEPAVRDIRELVAALKGKGIKITIIKWRPFTLEVKIHD